jgi:hypothetical protein
MSSVRSRLVLAVTGRPEWIGVCLLPFRRAAGASSSAPDRILRQDMQHGGTEPPLLKECGLPERTRLSGKPQQSSGRWA